MTGKPFDEAKAIAERLMGEQGWARDFGHPGNLQYWAHPDGRVATVCYMPEIVNGNHTDQVAEVKLNYPGSAQLGPHDVLVTF